MEMQELSLSIAHIIADYARWSLTISAGSDDHFEAAALTCLDASRLCADLGTPVAWDDIGAHCQYPHPLYRLAMALAAIELGDEPLSRDVLSIVEHLRSFYHDYPPSHEALKSDLAAQPSHKLTDAVMELYAKMRDGQRQADAKRAEYVERHGKQA